MLRIAEHGRTMIWSVRQVARSVGEDGVWEHDSELTLATATDRIVFFHSCQPPIKLICKLLPVTSGIAGWATH